MTYPKVLVIGGTSGIGLELVKQLLLSGSKVAVIGRNESILNCLASEHQNEVFPFVRDVTDHDQIPDYLSRIAEQLGGLDLVIYSAGLLLDAEGQQFNFENDQKMIEVNYLAAVAWLNAVAERFQAVGHGTIVGIGSVAGDRGRRARPVYGSTKAALHTYLESLRNRLNRHGVKVVTIKPGPVDTPMTKGHAFKNKMPVEVAAKKILKLANRPGEHYLLLTHKIIFNAIKITPSWIFKHLNI